MMMTIASLMLDCEFEHEPAEPQTIDEPGWPAICTLVSAELAGVDIVQILDPAIVQELERRAAWG